MWPNDEGDIFVPHEDVGSIVSHPSARDPGMSARVTKFRIVVSDGKRRVSALETAKHGSREVSNRSGRPKQTRMPRGAAERPAVLVVHFTNQTPAAPLIVFGRRDRRTKTRRED